MEKHKRRCKHCKCFFNPCPKVVRHEYCNKEQCQKARKRSWQEKEMDENPVYRKDQRDAQKLWRENNPDYWRKYRERNRRYADCNREKQKGRNEGNRDPACRQSVIAKMDAIKKEERVISGIYRLIPIATDPIAKMDGIIVEISDISAAYNTVGSLIAKMDA